MGANVRDLRARLDALKSERAPYESVYQNLIDNILPTAGRLQEGDKRDFDDGLYDYIYDATATDAVGVLSAGMLSGMTSPARPWFRLSTGDEDLDEVYEVQAWLSKLTSRMQRVFLNSNVYQALEHCYRELGVFGTACMVLAKSEMDIIHVHPMTVGEYWLATDEEQRVNTIFRRVMMTCEQMVDMFGIDRVSKTVREKYEKPKGRYDRISVIHAIYPRKEWVKGSDLQETMRFASVYFEERTGEDDSSVLLEEGFPYFPGLCPRWEVSSSAVYGTSPGMKALRPVMGLQVEVKRKGQGIDIQTNPPMLFPDTMEDRQVDLAPGGISYYPAGGSPQQVVPAVAVNLNLNHLMADITETKTAINGYFYRDLFTAVMSTPRTNRTATEVDQIAQERMSLLGPVLQRLNSELLDPLIGMTYNFMLEADQVPELPAVLVDRAKAEGRPFGITVTYESILVQALRSSGITAEDRFLTTVISLSQSDPSVVDRVDFDAFVKKRALSQGIDPELIRSDEAVEKMREARQQAQQQQQQMANAQQMASVAQSLGDINPALMSATDISAYQGY